MVNKAVEDDTHDNLHSIPIARVKAIVALSADSIPTSPEALFAYAKAAELFIEKLVKDLSEEHGENITYDELSQYILGNDDLDYLHSFFPARRTFDEAIRLMKEKENAGASN